MNPSAATILVVEDEAMIRMLAVDMLDALGASTLEAGSAAEALDAARTAGPIDAAMIDLSLPDGLGDQLAIDLRALRPALPVIMTTGHDAEMISPSVREMAGLILLPKPYEFAALEAALAQVLP